MDSFIKLADHRQQQTGLNLIFSIKGREFWSRMHNIKLKSLWMPQSCPLQLGSPIPNPAIPIASYFCVGRPADTYADIPPASENTFE